MYWCFSSLWCTELSTEFYKFSLKLNGDKDYVFKLGIEASSNSQDVFTSTFCILGFTRH